MNKRVVITGGAGFIARHLISALAACGTKIIAADVSNKPEDFPPEADFLQADLLDKTVCAKVFAGADYVFHLAAIGWGFHENLKHQPQILTDNLLLNSNVIDGAYKAGVKGYLLSSSAAVYPGYLEVMQEDALWDEPPHGSEQYYAWSKRVAEIQARAYYDHYGMPVAIVRLFNPYGPFDNFDPDKSHVVPALIRRAVAGENPFSVWGTGKPVRSFIHAADAARGMLIALIKYPVCEPVNLASNETTSIKELVELVLEATGRKGVEIKYDIEKPDGHPHRTANVNRAAEKLGLTGYITLREGLKNTIDWYREHINGQ